MLFQNSSVDNDHRPSLEHRGTASRVTTTSDALQRKRMFLGVVLAAAVAASTAASTPITPFSPLCLIDPTLPQCAQYIRGVAPANCSNVSPACEQDLFRLNDSLALDIQFISFVATNLHCDLDAIQPCWQGINGSSPVGVDTGRFKQGSCIVHCKHNVTELNNVCQQEDGFLCDSEYDIGLDGTELKVILPVCLPKTCQKNDQNDLNSIQHCMNQHTCDSLSPRARGLLPECTVTLPGCLNWTDIYYDVVLVMLSCLGALVSVAILIKLDACNLCCRNKKSNTFDAKYFIQSRPSTPSVMELNDGEQKQHSINRLHSPLLTNNTSARYVLSDDLKIQQLSGRFALGDRRDSVVELDHQAEDFVKKEYQIGSSLVYRNIFFKYLGKRLMLRGVSGILSRGSCVAVIGAPDSGATTLLRCLAGRQPKGKVEGSFMLDGRPPDKKICRIIAYIPKEDINHPTLTVRETLEFSAQCRLPRTVSMKERSQRVNAWLQLLGLAHVSESIVGDAVVRGVSGGERRRVSIGVNTVAGHRLVIADSPTNGLDSDAAFNVVKTMRALADAHHNGKIFSLCFCFSSI